MKKKKVRKISEIIECPHCEEKGELWRIENTNTLFICDECSEYFIKFGETFIHATVEGLYRNWEQLKIDLGKDLEQIKKRIRETNKHDYPDVIDALNIEKDRIQMILNNIRRLEYKQT